VARFLTFGNVVACKGELAQEGAKAGAGLGRAQCKAEPGQGTQRGSELGCALIANAYVTRRGG